jgi:hypothetical protein
MALENLNDIYILEKIYSPTIVFALKDIDNTERFKCEHFPIFKNNTDSTTYRDQPSVSVSNLNNNYEHVLIVFGHGDKENFTPSALDIGNLNISYYKQEISNNKVIIESDLKVKDSDLSFIKHLNLKLQHAPQLSPPHTIINFLKGLNWIYPHFDTIHLDRFTELVCSDYWFRKSNIDHYLEEIKSLKWNYRSSSRFKHGEGTIYNLHSILTPPDNKYMTHLIETITKTEIYHSDFANGFNGEMQVTDKEIADVKFNHLDRTMILAFANFTKSKYFLSLIRDYERFPFKTLSIDI